MAGDWIKIRHSLIDDPDVMKLSDTCRTDDLQVVGMLVKFWTWADRHTADGTGLAITAERIDKMVGCDGFAAALREINWLAGEDGSLQLPNFERHNGMSAKARELEAEAKRIRRMMSDKCPTQKRKNVRPEKRREEKKQSPNGDCKYTPEQVEAIYKAYPRKMKPKDAKSAIAKASKKIPFDDLMKAVLEFADSPKGKGDFCPYPATWFNAEEWNDDRAEWNRRDNAGRRTSGPENGAGVNFTPGSQAEGGVLPGF